MQRINPRDARRGVNCRHGGSRGTASTAPAPPGQCVLSDDPQQGGFFRQKGRSPAGGGAVGARGLAGCLAAGSPSPPEPSVSRGAALDASPGRPPFSRRWTTRCGHALAWRTSWQGTRRFLTVDGPGLGAGPRVTGGRADAAPLKGRQEAPAADPRAPAPWPPPRPPAPHPGLGQGRVPGGGAGSGGKEAVVGGRGSLEGGEGAGAELGAWRSERCHVTCVATCRPSCVVEA